MTLADLVAEFEGFRAKPYLPTPDDVPTIGYGTTVYPDGRAVTLKDPPCTRAKAREWLAAHLEEVVGTALKTFVKVPLTENQRIALGSLIYNIGSGAFSRSTLLRLLNRKDYAGAADEFLKWNKQKGKTLPGLTRRRTREREIFLTGR